MEQREIDCRGLQCPQPVVNTRKVFNAMVEEGHPEFNITTIVDNDVAVENVTRFAGAAGCYVAADKKEDGIYLNIYKPAGAGERQEEGAGKGEMPERGKSPCEEKLLRDTIFLVTSDALGQGEEELGRLLMRSMIYSLTETGVYPSAVLFLNRGVYLAAKGSPVMDELKQMEAKGVDVFSCGTCLDYYRLKDKLEVGKITNMYHIAEAIREAGRCITL